MTTAQAKEKYDELTKDCPVHESNMYLHMGWAIFRLFLEQAPQSKEAPDKTPPAKK